jgi:predicted dinucleotide-binding enzyme
MKIAIIGTGNVGRALGSSFVRGGHDVTLVARDAAKTQTVAREIGARAGDDLAQAVADAQVVVLATPFSATDDVASKLGAAAAGKVVVEVSNPLTPDYSAIATAGGPSAAERLAARLSGASVVKAFNTMFATIQADPAAQGTQADGLFATDDESARATIAELLTSIGARPVYVGPLVRARELEALGFLNIGIQMIHGGDWRSAIVFLGVPVGATQVPATARA